jgi:putative tryptophan/tyrosine transport system substrate-binding protein
MKRREFIAIAGGAAAWPLTARAQQPAVPVVGFLRPNRADEAGHLFAAVRQGLRESGYPSDKITIEARWADDRAERLPSLASELVNLQVSAIVGSVDAALAAKKATTNTFQSFLSLEAIQKRSGLCPTSVDQVAMLPA